MTIRVLLADADGVVQNPQPNWLQDFVRIGGGADIVREILSAETATIAGKADLAEVLAEVIDRRGLSVTPAALIEHWCRVEVDHYALSLVSRVRRAGVITALATNQQSYRGSWMQTHLPYADHFDRQFYSYELGLAKPDPAYFEAIIDALGIAPGEAVFVDDVATNVRAAESIGIHGAHFSRFQTFGSLRGRLRNLGVPGI